jgi:hypothetical protein
MTGPRDANEPPPARPARPRPAARDDSPLTDEQHHLLRNLARQRRPIQAAARTARISGITILVIGVLAAPVVAVAPTALGAVMLLVVGAVGTIELIGAGRMQARQAGAATLLGLNQTGFMLAIMIYCVIQMVSFSTAEIDAALAQGGLGGASADELGLGSELQGLTDVLPWVAYGFYGLIMVLTLLFQGGLALYYFARRGVLRQAQTDGPDWARRVLDDVGA